MYLLLSYVDHNNYVHLINRMLLSKLDVLVQYTCFGVLLSKSDVLVQYTCFGMFTDDICR